MNIYIPSLHHLVVPSIMRSVTVKVAVIGFMEDIALEEEEHGVVQM